MKRYLIIFAALFVVSCSEAPRELVIFHTNDIHGRFVSEPASWRDGAQVGGVKALSGHLSKFREDSPHSIYLDAGDVMTGNPVCSIEYGGVSGGALLKMLHLMNCRAMVLGNHEFDDGPEHLRQFIRTSPVPLLSANVYEKTSGELITSPVHIFEENGICVGIIGLTLDDLASHAAGPNVEPFRIDDAAETAQRHIDELDPVTDLIILLTHLGLPKDRELAQKVRHADIIVGGHSHTRLPEPERVNGMLIVQAGSYCKNLGVLEVTVAGDTVHSFNGRLVELLPTEVTSEPPVAAFSDSIEALIQERYGRTIGQLKDPWTRGYHEGSNVGNWLCDRLCDRYGADVAFINSGGIRADLPAGPITELQVMQMLPFPNAVVQFEASGEDILKIAREQATAQSGKTHGILEMSGLGIKYKIEDGNIQLVKVAVQGKPVRENNSYRVVTMDYVAVSQPLQYFTYEPAGVVGTGEMVTDVIIDEIKKQKDPISGGPQPRLVRVI